MITVNGTDLTTLGFVGRDRRIPRMPGREISAIPIPNAIGPAIIGTTRGPDQLQVEGAIIAATHAALLTALDSLVTLLTPKTHTIRFSDITDREWVGQLLQAPTQATVLGRPWISLLAGATLAWQLEGPARAQADTVTAMTSGTTLALTLGTAPSPQRISITNGGAAPAITQVVVEVRAGPTTVIRTLTWTGSVAAGAALVIDANDFKITNAGANAIGGLSAASRFPIVDPVEGGTHLRVAVTGGGSLTINTTYRRRWY